MQTREAPSVKRVALHFIESTDQNESKIREGISSIARDGDYLWIAFDQSTTVERLRWTGEAYEEHQQFQLSQLLDLPGEEEVEMDIEGLDISDGFLWIAGSMSQQRTSPDPEDSLDEQVEALRKIEQDANRYNLMRLPLVTGGDGHPEPRKVALRGEQTVYAASMRTDGTANKLIWALYKDEHIKPYMAIPSKDNGFDIEGLTVVGERVFLGLRGPVLNGYAIMLEVNFKLKKKGRVLKPRKIGRDKQRFRKHFLNLRGMGIRECYSDHTSKDLFVLGGPTMDLDGSIVVWRIAGGLEDETTSVVHEPEALFDITHAEDVAYGTDKAEGVCDHPEGGFLVVYDSPAKDRKIGRDGVYADVYGA